MWKKHLKYLNILIMNNDDIQKILGISLREIRIAKGLTQEQLAELIGKENGTIYRLEAGKNFLKCETLTKLCNVLNVHPSLLFSSHPAKLIKTNEEAINQITHLLQTFSQEKLNDAYNILSVLNK